MKVIDKAQENKRLLLSHYRTMWLIRHFESALTGLSKKGELRGSLHLCAGQEALPAGASTALRKDDYLTATYRGHGYVIGKGCDLKAIAAEVLGRQTGLSHGRGGKMHLFDLSRGILGTNGIVGAGVGTAVGAALAAKLDGLDRVALTVFGEGALNQGHVHEAMNMSGLWDLPVVFLCENNLYAEMTPLERSSAVTDMTHRVGSYGIAAERIDGNDSLAVHEAIVAAATRARSGKGPQFIEAMTYRTCGHYQNDPGTSYRTQKEVEHWRKKDPIDQCEAKLKDLGISRKELNAIDSEAAQEVVQAVAFGLESPWPSPDDLSKGLFV